MDIIIDRTKEREDLQHRKTLAREKVAGLVREDGSLYKKTTISNEKLKQNKKFVEMCRHYNQKKRSDSPLVHNYHLDYDKYLVIEEIIKTHGIEPGIDISYDDYFQMVEAFTWMFFRDIAVVNDKSIAKAHAEISPALRDKIAEMV